MSTMADLLEQRVRSWVATQVRRKATEAAARGSHCRSCSLQRADTAQIIAGTSAQAARLGCDRPGWCAGRPRGGFLGSDEASFQVGVSITVDSSHARTIVLATRR